MAGGEGTRLRPLTSNQPKPMVPIVGKPCMEHIFDLLRKHAFEDVVVTVAFLPQAIRSYFGDGEQLGLHLEYSVEESPLGTAGSVRLASQRLEDTFVVISGDALCDFDLDAIVEFHRERGAAATIGLKAVENPLEFGIVVTDDDGRVERFLEKPSWGQVFSDTINTGIYVLEPEVLRHVPTDRPFDFSTELFPLLLEMGRPIYGYVCDGYWQDIGNLDQYRQANFDALDGKVDLHISGLRIRGDVWVGDGVEIDDVEGVEGPAFIGNYTAISPESSVGPYTVLGPATTLRERARIARTVVDSSCYIGRSAVVEGAVLGRNCDIRPHARIHEGVAIGDQVTIGDQAVIYPGVRIYPYKEVEYGAQVHESVIWESRGVTRVFQQDGVTGLVNVDLTPEVALRFGAALGTALPRGARVVASRESAPAYRMVKRALISGLNSTGVGVADLRTLPAPVGKHLLKTQGYDAAFHVGASTTDPEAVQIRLFERPGIALSSVMQKEIEKHFTRQELRRVPFGDVGSIAYPARARESYASDLLADLDRDLDPRAELPHRRRLRVLGGQLRVAARARAARRRGGHRARIRVRLGRRPRTHRRDDRPGAAARRGGERRLRRGVRSLGGAAVPDRRTRPRDPPGPGASALPQPAAGDRRLEGGRADHRHEPGRGGGREPLRGRAHAGHARRR